MSRYGTEPNPTKALVAQCEGEACTQGLAAMLHLERRGCVLARGPAERIPARCLQLIVEVHISSLVVLQGNTGWWQGLQERLILVNKLPIRVDSVSLHSPPLPIIPMRIHYTSRDPACTHYLRMAMWWRSTMGSKGSRRDAKTTPLSKKVLVVSIAFMGPHLYQL